MVQIIKKSERRGFGFETPHLRVAPQPERKEYLRVASQLEQSDLVAVMPDNMNNLVFVARMLIRGYQLFIRPILSSNCCRFYPSCSDYALTAITQYGLLKGGWQSLRRLARCHSWSLGGYDPVIINKEKN